MSRHNAFAAMRAGSMEGILDSSIYGVPIETMSTTELQIALGWALSQTARICAPQKETRQ